MSVIFFSIIPLIIGLFFGFLVGYYSGKKIWSLKSNQISDYVNKIQNEMKDITINALNQLIQQKNNIIDSQSEERLQGISKSFSEKMQELNLAVISMEKTRREDYGSILRYMDSVKEMAENINNTATMLKNTVGNTIEAGKWSEIGLENLFEYGGLRKYIDFTTQVVLEDGSRPDFIINLPGNRKVVIDSKAVVRNFLNAENSQDTREKEEFLKKFKKDIQDTIKKLSERNYPEKIDNAYEYTLLYIPFENVFSYIYVKCPDIVEYSFSSKVFLTSPVSIIPILRGIEISWREEEMIKNSKKIVEFSLNLYGDFKKMLDMIKIIGKDMKKTSRDYNDLINLMQIKVLNDFNRFAELSNQETEKSSFIESVQENNSLD
ncbi:DNA recombination protein RmuC [Caldiplasma sukawensis]